MALQTDSAPLDIREILQRLPHRFPFLLVDRVLEFRAGESIRALKNVTYNEPFFAGHFPGRPPMPGVMIIEALAQTAGLLCFMSATALPQERAPFYFVGIDNARFRKPVAPGDQLLLLAQVERSFKGIRRFSTLAQVGDDAVAQAHIMVAPETDR